MQAHFFKTKKKSYLSDKLMVIHYLLKKQIGNRGEVKAITGEIQIRGVDYYA